VNWRMEVREIKRVALSLRVSTDGQVDGHSLDTQGTQLRDWAAREGWEVIEVYTDAGRSAFRKVEGREAFLRMIDDAEAGKFDAVLVSKSDRFMRGAGHARIIRDRLSAAGVQYKSLEEPGAWDGTPGGFLLGSNADTFAEYYSLDLSVKMTKGLRTRAEKGLTLGDVPFGYLRDEPQQPIYPCPSEAQAVLHLFKRYQSGLVSMGELAEELNALGLKPRSKRGKNRFSAASVKGMLKNPVYAGYVTRHGEILRDGLHEAIVPRDLFERVQRVIDERARRPRVYARRPPHPYMLGGIAFCVRCGGPLWANSTGRGTYHYYRCAADRRGEICDDGGVSAGRTPRRLSWSNVRADAAASDVAGAGPGADYGEERYRLD
jgi:site-specific DNA recombinase